MPALADQDLFIGSESSFYRVLHAHGQAHRRGRARAPQEPRPVPRLRADRPNAVMSWDITYLPTTVRGVWLYLYLVIDVWSRKVVAWDVAEREDAQFAADLVGPAGLRERISTRAVANRWFCTPTTATPCAPPRSRPGWKSWGCCVCSPGHGCRMTIHTRNPCSARSNTVLTTQTGRLPARQRPVSGWCRSWIGTTISTVTAASSS